MVTRARPARGGVTPPWPGRRADSRLLLCWFCRSATMGAMKHESDNAPASRWRLPSRAPGPASGQDGGGNPFYPDELQYDSLIYYVLARDSEARAGRHEADSLFGTDEGRNAAGNRDRFVRGGIVAAFGSMEARINRAAYSHAATHEGTLETLVRDVLDEQEAYVDERGRIRSRSRRLGLLPRFCFLTAFVTGHEFPRDGTLWQDLVRAVAIRDEVVHPKPPFPWEMSAEQLRHVIDAVTMAFRTVERLLRKDPLLGDRLAEEFLDEVSSLNNGWRPGDGANPLGDW